MTTAETKVGSASADATLTGYVQLFERAIGGKRIVSIEIPMIQRDYAQGRAGKTVERIRDKFVAALHDAVEPGAPMLALDFVYGDVTEDGKFFPLDGQQRLTTLYLLHWYVARRAEVDIDDAPWLRFSYATRDGTRRFCEFLAEIIPEWDRCTDDGGLSAWLKDQVRYRTTWNADPSIRSMLVMLDAIHDRRVGAPDFAAAWRRLSDLENPPIRFTLLPMAEHGLTDALYVRMNSRGRPLTDFENLKAELQALLKFEANHPEQAERFSRGVDVDWGDVFWEYKGEDDLIDDELMRYFQFVTEIWAWEHCENDGFDADKPIEDLARFVYVRSSSEPIDFLLHAFDVWHNPEGAQKGFVRGIFEELFTLDAETAAANSALLFRAPGRSRSVDFFGACCRTYGTPAWTYGDSLMFYAVLVHKMAVRFDGHPDDRELLRKRLRTVRNLIEGSRDELAMRKRDASARMKEMLSTVRNVILQGDLTGLRGFSVVQIADERSKKEFLDKQPLLEQTIHALEDHPLLQGTLTVFAFDSDFEAIARAFDGVFTKEHWLDVTGALLSKGPYGREWQRGEGAYVAMGSEKNAQPWRDLFRGRRKDQVHPATQAVMALLREVATNNYDSGSLARMQNSYLQAESTAMDWRYYFVKYPIMRGAPEGAYVFGKSRYRACRLEGKYVYTFQDPYLVALVEEAGYSIESEHFARPWPWFYGIQDETGVRALTLVAGGISIECVPEGWQLRNRDQDSLTQAQFDQICAKHGIGSDLLLRTVGHDGLDKVDRIEAAAKVLRELVAMLASPAPA